MAKPKAKKKVTKAVKPKKTAKAKPKVRARAKTKSKPTAKSKPAKAKPARAKPAKAKPAGSSTANGNGSIAPFSLAETEPGKYSLVLHEFEPGSVFAAARLDGGGYAWESIAKHVTEVIAPDLGGRCSFDSEASMFCAYGEDRAALEGLGAELARLFHDANTLSAVIQQIGRDGFED